MNLRDFYAAVAGEADTPVQRIDASEVSRVLACARRVLRGLSFPERFALAWRFAFGRMETKE